MAGVWVPIDQLFDATNPLYPLDYPITSDSNFGTLITIKSGYEGLVDENTLIRFYTDDLHGAGELGVGFYQDDYPRYTKHLSDNLPYTTTFADEYESYPPETYLNALVTIFSMGYPSEAVSLYVDFFVDLGASTVWTTYRNSAEQLTD